MNKKTIRDVSLKGKRVLMRVDFNVPVKDGVIGDSTRITAALPTIRYVLEQGGSLVLMSHLGRPKGKGYEAEFSLKPVAEHLAKVLGRPVVFAPDCLAADGAVKAMKPGDVVMLENTRFYKEEEASVKKTDDLSEEEYKAKKAALKEKQQVMAQKLATYGDLYCNDAFGSAHRAHASTAVVCKFFKDNVAGFLMEKEIDYLSRVLEAPEHPCVALLGGAKVSDKVNVITNLLTKVDALIIGGAMAYTFYRAKGLPTGKSLVEEDKVDLAKAILQKAQASGKKLLLPVDHLIAESTGAKSAETVGEAGIKDGTMALDIGPQSIKLFAAEIVKAKTVVWNGPMGYFENPVFAAGTVAIAKAIAATKCLSIVGGGDSVSAVNQSGLADKMTHISTGGGASLEFLEGKILPGVAALTNK